MANTSTSLLQTVKQSLQQGRLDNAKAALEQLFLLNINEHEKAEALYLSAVTCRLAKDFQHAIKRIDDLLALRPDYGRAYQEAGYCYLAMGNQQDASSAFFKATQYNPALLTSWQQLLTIYTQFNDHQAKDIAQQQIAYWQGLPAPIRGGYDLMYENNLVDAERVCRQFLQQHKHQPDAMMLLAEIGIQMKVYHDAEFLLESCIALYPDNQRAVSLYLGLLAKLGKHDLIEHQVTALPATVQNSTAMQMALANACLGLNKTEQAIRIFNSLLTADPDKPAVWLALGHAHKTAGAAEQAVEAYKQAAHYHPSFGDAYWSLANMKSYRFTNEEISRMQDRAESPSLSVDDKVHLCFALGKALEDSKQFDASFAYYEKGNALKKATLSFSIERTEQAILQQVDAFPVDVGAPSSKGFPAPDPIFIVGMPRAGSTLIEQILASHSDIDGTMELHNILALASQINTPAMQSQLANQKETQSTFVPYPFAVSHLTHAQRYQLGKAYIEQTRCYREQAPFFIDKMPNNFMHIGLIKQILPNAKIIDARREPMDCCFSNFKQLFGEGQEFSYSLDDVARYYQAYLSLMDHWHQCYPGDILTVHHEDVLDDLPGQVARILDYIGVPFEEACVAFHQTQRLIKTPSAEQVRQPINRSGQGRWKPYASHLDALTKRFQ